MDYRLDIVAVDKQWRQWRIQGRGPGGLHLPLTPPPSLIFKPNWGPKGREKNFWRPPPLSQGLEPALVWTVCERRYNLTNTDKKLKISRLLRKSYLG